MAEDKHSTNSNANGVYVEVTGEEESNNNKRERKGSESESESSITLYQVLNRLAYAILFPEPSTSASLLKRIKISIAENAPLLPEASRKSARDLLLWTRQGSPFRAILVITVGTITSVALTGLLVFLLFFLAATINAVVISLLVSLAAAGGFLAIFFACVAAVYVGALLVAAIAISVTTFWASVAVLFATGWIGFFYIVWLVTSKSFGYAKHTLSATGSAISTYSAARHVRHQMRKDSD
ncbi:hypothetical protein HN51_037452 [Arachis hypogaea]|uniref:Uncharacterized protein n=1 Tax=Arachis hypogaea TaxID=3818 RepID=A0A444ZVY7_ARAHY|nr:uncharacterized protein LOC107631423 [Arachis ipaensis]XP_025638605.1 uncharacterized protein LOC112733751 [Arachis hypogaea]QHO02998.1 uncharacterized protein DS421_13g428590 [Arachis hypogaea]RYR18329.1 hypothetical protein Ahy_B03g062943 [Arachis hypogaea]